MLAVDLGIFHRDSHAVGFREAVVWTCAWVCLALVFCLGLYLYVARNWGEGPARQIGLEFLAGYIVELSLSVDNVFVFVLIFSYFAVPPEYHHRILFYGILGALIFRAGFIALGSALLQYGWVAILFGLFLIFTGIKMLLQPEKELRPEDNRLIRLLHRVIPVTADLDGQSLFVRLGGKLHATSLFVTLAFIEISDIVFAVDSVPAIFAITREPLVVFTSNVFAILGLRSLYFLLANAIGRFHLLRYGLAIILIFVGVKMSWLDVQWGGHFPIGISLGVIAAVLAASIGLSLAIPPKDSYLR